MALKGRNTMLPERLLRPFRAWCLRRGPTQGVALGLFGPFGALEPTQGVALGYLVWPLRGIGAGSRLRPFNFSLRSL